MSINSWRWTAALEQQRQDHKEFPPYRGDAPGGPHTLLSTLEISMRAWNVCQNVIGKHGTVGQLADYSPNALLKFKNCSFKTAAELWSVVEVFGLAKRWYCSHCGQLVRDQRTSEETNR